MEAIPYLDYEMHTRAKINSILSDIWCDWCEELIREGAIYFSGSSDEIKRRKRTARVHFYGEYHFCYKCYDTQPHEVYPLLKNPLLSTNKFSMSDLAHEADKEAVPAAEETKEGVPDEAAEESEGETNGEKEEAEEETAA